MIISNLNDKNILVCYGLDHEEFFWLWDFAKIEKVSIRELLLSL